MSFIIKLTIFRCVFTVAAKISSVHRMESRCRANSSCKWNPAVVPTVPARWCCYGTVLLDLTHGVPKYFCLVFLIREFLALCSVFFWIFPFPSHSGITNCSMMRTIITYSFELGNMADFALVVCFNSFNNSSINTLTNVTIFIRRQLALAHPEGN